jgi:hypothetical protein
MNSIMNYETKFAVAVIKNYELYVVLHAFLTHNQCFMCSVEHVEDVLFNIDCRGDLLVYYVLESRITPILFLL